MNKKLRNIIGQAFDLHVHVGPEVIPRKYTVASLAQTETGKLKGCALKNHFYPTAALLPSEQDDFELFGSVVLNNAVGGMNPEAVFAASLVAPKPLIVWFPTINSEQFLKTNKYEIAPEWVEDKSLRLKSADETRAVRVTADGKLLPETKQVIEMIAQVGGVLATGHIAAEESVLVARFARSLSVPVIITHPIYQHINMNTTQQKKLAELGCFMEQPYSMYSMDKIPIAKIVQQIKVVGADSVILSSDVGQTFSPSPSEALMKFAKLLMAESITIKEVEQMLVKNPRKILFGK